MQIRRLGEVREGVRQRASGISRPHCGEIPDADETGDQDVSACTVGTQDARDGTAPLP